jgi:preprotein translocase subunit SecY
VGSADPNAGIMKRSLQDLALVLSPGQPLYLVLFGALIIFSVISIQRLYLAQKKLRKT